LESTPGPRAQVAIVGRCPGVVLDQLDITVSQEGLHCIELYDVSLAGGDPPVVIQKFALHHGADGELVQGKVRWDFNSPKPCRHVVIRNNTLDGCKSGIVLVGAVERIHVVGNRIMNSEYCAIDLMDLLSGTANVLVANNTLLRNRQALRLWD